MADSFFLYTAFTTENIQNKVKDQVKVHRPGWGDRENLTPEPIEKAHSPVGVIKAFKRFQVFYFKTAIHLQVSYRFMFIIMNKISGFPAS